LLARAVRRALRALAERPARLPRGAQVARTALLALAVLQAPRARLPRRAQVTRMALLARLPRLRGPREAGPFVRAAWLALLA
jgi:hypothetical protein